ncbi:MAG: TerC family protein [Sporomusaceae bacterium]|nr:TerC family protein [Sporomusaceae bacterium]
MDVMFFSSEWLLALGGIILIDVLLGGDNAVLIAMASKNLSEEQRKKVILWGSVGAIFARIFLVFVASFLLEIPYLQFLGGLALLWIAVHLAGKTDKKVPEGTAKVQGVIAAIKAILIADVIMSLDNVLALAAMAQAAPHGKYLLIIFGILASIPMIVFGSQLLMKLMDRYPVIIYVGAAILGYAAAEMILGDKRVGVLLAHYHIMLKVGLTAFVVAFGYWRKTQSMKLAASERG